MFKNYFKTAWRSLIKSKFYSLINIAGLTAGLAIGIIILLWVQDELSYDGFHKNVKNIYRLENQVGTGNSVQIWSVTNSGIGVQALQKLPEIKAVTRITENYYYLTYQYGENLFKEKKACFIDPSFFTLFDFPLIKGSMSAPFSGQYSVVLTESTAHRYFGDQDPIGKVIMADHTTPFTVSGVIKDIPKNSNLRAELFFPMDLFKTKFASEHPGETVDDNWRQYNFNTYLLVNPGTNMTALADKLRNLHLQRKADDTDIKYLPLALSRLHLYRADGTDGGIGTVRIFMIIALLILAIACINYVNLSTARSMLRIKEVSVRKVVGALRSQLFLQFIVETALLFCLALFFGLILIYLFLPLFNDVSGKELSINFTDYHIWLVIAGAAAGTLLVSSIYPALLLSSFEPVKALKGKIVAGVGGAAFRKVLVVGQFVISIVLITGTIIITQQLKYIRAKNLGYDKSYVFSFFMRNTDAHYTAIRSQLLHQTGIKAVTRASGNIVQLGGLTGNNNWDGKGADQTLMLHTMAVDQDYLQFFKMQLLQGHNFFGTPADSAYFMLNEAAVKMTGIKDPIGKRFKLWKQEGTIIGVVKDFHFASLKQKIEPAILYSGVRDENTIFVKTTGADAPAAIAAAKATWMQYNTGIPFEYNFLDDTYNHMYESEQRTGILFDTFAGIAIFISCLGLLGLTAYTAQVRKREIGVRKVLGASVSGIIRLLTGEFIRLVLIAILIAVPVSWYAMRQWLDGFAYSIPIRWTVFLVAGLAAVMIAICTISFQSIKAATANPVKSLRTE